MSERACGTCQACCHVKPIPTLSAAWADCQHQCEAGCEIYSQRPEGCRRYSCAWIDGWGGNDDRPDLLGVLFEVAPGPVGGLEVRGIETRAGGGARAAQLRLREWSETGARVSLLRYGEPV